MALIWETIAMAMEEDILLQISDKLKEYRLGKGGTLQEIADSAGVSKGLLSQVENGRTIPSLPVLLGLIKALDVDLNQFFKDIIPAKPGSTVLIKRKEQYQHFTKENATGFHYRRILSTQHNDHHIDVVLLRLEKNAKRPMVRTKAYEFKYVLQGTVEYKIGKDKYLLYEGDSMFFDANELHNPKCVSDGEALMLVIYFFTND